MEILVALLSNNKVYVLLGFVISSVLFCHSMLPRKLKGPLNWPLLGMLPSLFLHLGDIYEWTTQMLIDCSGTLKFKAPWMTTMFSLVTADPKNIEYLTKTRFANFPKGDYYKSIFDDLLGDGILNTDGDQWAWERRMTSSILHSSDYKSHMIQTVEELVQLRLLPVLEDACRRGSTVDLQDLLTRFTVDNMCIVGLGVDLGCLARDLPSNQLARAFEEAVAGTLFRFITPSIVWKTMRFLGLGTEAKLRESLDIINKFMEEVIVVRRQEMMRGETKVERWDYLSKTMLLRDDQGRYFSNKFVRDLSINFVLAGRDTMSVALSWFFWLLIQHTSVEQKIVLEIRSILTRRPVLEGRLHPNDSARFTLEELKEMNYLHAALSETLRLYPSLPINFKEVIEDEVLPDGTCLKKGETILYPIYSMGRMENIWGKDCREFKPERWVKDGVFVPEGAPKYLTFNGGPRVCLGKDFAFVHMKWVAAVILCRYSLKMDSAFVVEPKLGVTTCMKNGLLVALHPR